MRKQISDESHSDLPEVNWHSVAKGDPTDGRLMTVHRILKGLSIRDLAEAAGVSAMAISKFERGKGGLGSDGLLKIGKALGVPYWSLFGWWELRVADRGRIAYAKL